MSSSSWFTRLRQFESLQERLVDLLREKVRNATEDSLSGEVSSRQKLDELQRLAQLVELSARSRPKSTQRSLVVAAGVVVAGVVVSLLFMRVGSTEIQLSITASQIGFSLDTAQDETMDSIVAFTKTVRLRSLIVSGVRGMTIPDYHHQPEVFVTAPQVAFNAEDENPIILGAVTLGAGARVTVAHSSETPFGVRLRLSTIRAIIKTSLSGSWVLETLGQRERMRYNGVRVASTRRERALGLALTMSDSGDLFSSPLKIIDVQLFRPARRNSGEPSRVSTLRSARLTVIETGVTRDLQPSDLVLFDIAGEGNLRGLVITGEGLRADISARVRGLTVSGQTLMPTIFERLSHQPIGLVWAAASSILLTLLAIFRWWRSPL